MKTWLITNYGGPARIVGDIVINLSRKSKSTLGSRGEKLIFHSAITGSIQRLEKISRLNYIDKAGSWKPAYYPIALLAV